MDDCPAVRLDTVAPALITLQWRLVLPALLPAWAHSQNIICRATSASADGALQATELNERSCLRRPHLSTEPPYSITLAWRHRRNLPLLGGAVLKASGLERQNPFSPAPPRLGGEGQEKERERERERERR